MTGVAALPRKLPANHSSEKGLLKNASHPCPGALGVCEHVMPTPGAQPHTRTAVQISTQHLANYCRDLLPMPLLPPEKDPLRKLSIFQGQSDGWRVPGHVHLRSVRVGMEAGCRADATSNINASPAAITGACRGNCTFLSLQPATVIPWAVCPSPFVTLPRESASARDSPQGNAVKNALYVLRFWFHFCIWFWNSPHPSHIFSLPEK